ncbi:DUF6600 domain-containing protein [Aestuariivirga sp.]|uniref:DUF6600 domain-containing protein n=1 Tax=Aestuariivirga sp. TaxID=2650926 RepID=UPI00391BADD2
MKIRHILAGTAIASLALVGGSIAPPGLSFVPQAEAAVSISFSVFYDELSAHGSWVNYNDAYVFIPANVGSDWRPYTLGHWVYTDRYGWTWVSDEAFGWATYHYGRWGYAEDIGWYWVPGKRWAPAWVSWRRSADYVVWAPLPPDRDGDVDVSISISVGDIPEFYWVAVPTRRFLEPDIHVVVIRDDREIRQVVERTEFIGVPKITNNIVVNNVIDVDIIEKETGKDVKTVEVRETDDPRQARASEDQVTVFQGEIAADEKAKPPKVSEVSEVKKVKRGGASEDAAGTSTEEPASEAAEGGTTEAPADAAQTEEPGAPAAEGQTDKADKADKAKKAKNADEDAADTATSDQPAGAAQPETAEQPAPSEDQPAAAENQDDGNQGQAKKKAEDAAEEPEDATGSTAAPEQPAAEAGEDSGNAQGKAKGKAKKDEQQACDPATDANCAPAQ